MKYLLTEFSKNFPIEITNATLQQYIILMYAFETRQKHANALNSPMLGIDPMFFTTQDTNNLFDVLEVDQSEFKKAIKRCPSINPSFKVSSDPYNLLITWGLHRASVSTHLNDEQKLAMQIALAKMLHYKFFTSLVNHNFRYGANEDIMRAVINGLTEKFDLIKYGTWKNVIEARCEDLLSHTSIHYQTIKKYDDDKKITYLLSDTQTRLRNKLRIIINEYYNAKKKGDTISNYKLSTEIDGEKIMTDQVSTYDTMITNISNQVLNVNQWLNQSYIKICVGLFGNISESLMKQFLVSFSQYASMQIKNGKLDHVLEDRNGKLYLGSRILIKTILQKTYRVCVQSKVNMRSKTDILSKTKNIYAASRVNDPTIIEIKESVFKILDENVKITREATRASLRIAFICYIMLKSFEFL